MTNCPNCGASNAPEDTFCRYCGADLKDSPAPQQPQPPQQPQQPYQQPGAQGTVECKNCGALNNAASPQCISCGNSLAQPQPSPYQQPAYPPPGSQPPPSQQPDYSPSSRRGFRWWMLLTWPFMILGWLFRCNANSRRRYNSCSSSGCNCADCANCAGNNCN